VCTHLECIVQYRDDQALDLSSFRAEVDGAVVTLGQGPEGAMGLLPPLPDGEQQGFQLMTPRVTVAIPTYNRSEMLRRTLQSVIAQTFTNFEVIVSDNASTDDTEAVVASFGDSRVRCLRLDENIGMLGNLTRCLHLGDAPYVMVLHSDDLIRPGLLAAAVDVLDTHRDVVFVHSAFSVIDGDDNVVIDRTAWMAVCGMLASAEGAVAAKDKAEAEAELAVCRAELAAFLKCARP